MPTISLALPHWLYWSGIALFPLAGLLLAWRSRQGASEALPSLPFAYMLLLLAGFVGAHRVYLKNRWWWIYVPLTLAIVVSNGHIRDGRELVSAARSDVSAAEVQTRRAEAALQRNARNAENRAAEARTLTEAANARMTLAMDALQRAEATTRALALALAGLLLADALLLPWLCAQRRRLERAHPVRPLFAPVPTEVDAGPSDIPELGNGLTRAIDALNRWVGAYVAWWAVIAVFFYYLEVVLRYLFNSPTTFVHEAMYLMFGMMYLLTGGYGMLINAHVRVDVVYAKMRPRRRVVADILTSVFFFIFAGTLVATSWIYLDTAWQVKEVSFSDWGIQYWPVKAVMLAGSVLLLLQGISKLTKDVLVLRSGRI